MSLGYAKSGSPSLGQKSTINTSGLQKFLLVHLAAFITILIITYPNSPVLFQLFGSKHEIAYIGYILIGIFSVVFLNITTIQYKYGLLRQSNKLITYVYCGSLMVLFVVSYLYTSSTAALRDLSSVFFLFFVVYWMRGRLFVQYYRAIVLILSVLIFVSGVVVVAYWLGFVDLSVWSVDKLLLPENSPILVRQQSGDFEWHLAYYLAVIAYTDIVFYMRQPFFFLEPGDVALYLLGPFFISMLDRQMPFRWFAVGIFGFALMASFSTLGIGLIIVSLVVGMVGIFVVRSRSTVFILALFLSLVILVSNADNAVEMILSTLGGNLLEQYYYFSTRGAFLQNINIANLWGGVTDTLDHRTYGFEIIFFRYGMVGGLLYLSSVLMFLYFSMRFLKSFQGLRHERLLAFSALFSCTLMAIKSPQIILFSSVFCYLYIRLIDVRVRLNPIVNHPAAGN